MKLLEWSLNCAAKSNDWYGLVNLICKDIGIDTPEDIKSSVRDCDSWLCVQIIHDNKSWMYWSDCYCSAREHLPHGWPSGHYAVIR
jgi:hypothetical protein